ncbi:HAD family hydrolase [Pilimelia columellifera]|uniref:HAD family hydrolase n=1 Tax=Pilimelia columellifera subsp. columellifera TaxID=706583 RepID=A0ABP6AQX9_9ACTN
MPAIRAVLFDFFGTLTQAIQRGPRHDRIARALGCDPSTMRTTLDRSFRERASGARGDAVTSLRWLCSEQGVRPAAARLRRAAAARIGAVAADTRLRPDALPTLLALRSGGLRTAVVSDCGHELPAFLPSLPIARLLDAGIFSVEVGCCKPDPEMYLTACRRLGVRPQECLYVGDGGSRELTGAAAVGMRAVRLTAPDLAGHLVFDADEQFDGPSVNALSEVLPMASGAARLPAPA